MSVILAFVLNLFATLLKLRSPHTHQRTGTCPVFLPNPGEVSTRIVNGQLAAPSVINYLASFNVNDKGSFCSGSLISRNWVLTAAHCYVDPETGGTWNNTFVLLGSNGPGDGARREVEQVICHEEYSPANFLLNDICLVKLSEDAPPNMTVIQLNSNPGIGKPGYYARAAGYGEIGWGDGNPGGYARVVDVPVKSSVRCAALHIGDLGLESIVGLAIKDESQFCAGYEAGGCSVCRGDSGGPLFVYDSNDVAVQIGITSFGAGKECAEARRPAIYTRVSKYLEWIESKGVRISSSADGQLHKGNGSEISILDRINPLCFPSDAVVTLEGGHQKQMKELNVGDMVLSSTGLYSRVFMFTHNLLDTKNVFLQLYFEASAKPIDISKSHYLYINNDLKPASEARVGDYLMLSSGEKSAIVSINEVVKEGLYNPQTDSGTIFVNNILTSTYTTAIKFNVAHSLLRPLVAASKVLNMDITRNSFKVIGCKNKGI